MTDFDGPFQAAPKTRPPAFRRIRADAPPATFSLRNVVGVAHIALGAMSFFNGFVAISFPSIGVGLAMKLAVGGVLFAVAAALVLAGLSMRDGQRRGAYVSIGVNGIRAVFFLAVTRGFSADFVLAAALLSGAVWLLPQLGSKGDATGV